MTYLTKTDQQGEHLLRIDPDVRCTLPICKRVHVHARHFVTRNGVLYEAIPFEMYADDVDAYLATMQRDGWTVEK